jgi:hypothetical protein
LKAPFAPWRFEPTRVDGKAVAAQAPLRVRLRGKSTGEGGYEVSMTSVDFSEYDPKATDSVTAERLAPPRYPEEAMRNGGQGDVILIIKVARDGTVADVIAEQVNMAVAGPSGPWPRCAMCWPRPASIPPAMDLHSSKRREGRPGNSGRYACR